MANEELLTEVKAGNEADEALAIAPEERRFTVPEVPVHDSFLEVDGLCKYFTVDTDILGRPTKFLKAVDNVSFKVKKGKTLGIVGESG